MNPVPDSRGAPAGRGKLGGGERSGGLPGGLGYGGVVSAGAGAGAGAGGVLRRLTGASALSAPPTGPPKAAPAANEFTRRLAYSSE